VFEGYAVEDQDLEHEQGVQDSVLLKALVDLPKLSDQY
jgi:hypothetical protein